MTILDARGKHIVGEAVHPQAIVEPTSVALEAAVDRGAVPEDAAAGRCTACGAFVGPYDTCPHCGAGTSGQVRLRALRIASVVLAVLGLAVLFGVARHSEVPAVQVGEAGATMNWAYIEIEGAVSREPAIDSETGAAKFWVRDATGEMMVTAYRAQAEALVAEGRMPAMGDEVAVAGTLRVREDFSYLVLDVPEHLKVWRAQIVDVAIGDVAPEMDARRVRIRGQVRADRTPYEGLRILTVADTTGRIEVLLPRDGAGPAALGPGAAVEVAGAVDAYRGVAQVSIGRWEDVRLLDEDVAVAPARAIGAIGPENVGQMVTLEGSIARVERFSAGVKVGLAADGMEITLLLWEDVHAALPDAAYLVPGAGVRVVGEVAEYRGALEIIPELPSDVTVVSTAPRVATSTQAPTMVPAGEAIRLPTGTAVVTGTVEVTIVGGTPVPLPATDTAAPAPTEKATTQPVTEPARWPTLRLEEITAAHVGSTISIAEAGIADVAYLSKGVKYTITDATGALVLLVWQDVLEAVPEHVDLLPGSVVQVTGEIEEYEGTLEIVPRAGEDVVVIDRGARLPVETWPVSRISGSDEGRVVAVAGRVVQVEGERWLNVRLNDGTGEIVVYLPERVVPYLPEGIVPGAAIAVTGQVDVYRGTVEIVPLAGADVQVGR